MSKSKGNVINPLEIIDQYGADALRLALIIRSTAGQDKSVGRPDFKAARNLTNKVWNATRFILMSQDQSQKKSQHSKERQHSKGPQHSKERKRLIKNQETEFQNRLNQIVADTTQQLNDLKIGLAAETLYNEFWHWYCDESIENSKEGLIGFDMMVEGLKVFLKLLHPFIPFVTEALWQELKDQGLIKTKLLITTAWPSRIEE